MTTTTTTTMQPAIRSADRLIFALDVATADDAMAWIDRLGDSVTFYKIGLELLSSGDYFRVLEALAARDKQVFADLKLHDVPATVAAAVAGLSRWPIRFLTVHAYPTMLRAAVDACGDIALLAVTVLTSMDQHDLHSQGVTLSPEQAVLQRARDARVAGCAGVIASGREAPALRAACGDDFLIVCPGIRSNSEAGGDDQKRTADVATAFTGGADHIVVGRPIRNAADPREAAFAIRDQIERALK